jgi:hypothetical protein
MKLNLIRFAVACIAFTTFASFIATDEDDDATKKKAPAGGSCTAYCVWIDNQGVYHYDPVAGAFTDCVKVDFASTCEVVGCHPILPCP